MIIVVARLLVESLLLRGNDVRVYICNMDPRLQVLLEYLFSDSQYNMCVYIRSTYIFPKYFILSARCDENQDYIINMVCIDIRFRIILIKIYEMP